MGYICKITSNKINKKQSKASFEEKLQQKRGEMNKPRVVMETERGIERQIQRKGIGRKELG